MSIEEMMNKIKAQPPDIVTGESSDSDQSSDADNALPAINEPDVSLDEMLSLACRQGKLDIVQLLLQSGAHVNHRNKAGNTPLLEACSQGHVLVANYLLEHGSKIDAPTETTLDSALTWACTLGNSSIVDTLLKKKADVEHRTKDGCTALMFACLAGHKDVAEKLLDASSEINVESESNKDSPLTFACWKGHFDVVELLLIREANIEHRTKEGFSPLMFAALGGHSKVAHKLLQCDAQVNVPSGSNNDIPLTSACWKGHHNVVKLLLEYSSNIEHRTKDGCTPLMLAAREGHIFVAELLLKNNAQVNVPSGSENNIPLTLACWKGHWEVVRLLLDNNSDIEHRNKAGCTPLMLASREGHYETTALLLERGAQVNVPSGSNDDTPLTLACWKGHKNVVLLLLDAKSNIDHQTKTGCTPLMEATREGHKDVSEILLNHNADVELPDNYGQSPLFMACWKGHRNVADLLLNRNAYRDCRTKTGITPLFQACRENHISIVELLLEHGAGVNTPFPNSRENPLTLCAEKGHQELVGLLLTKGAVIDCQTKKGCTPIFLSCKEGHLEISDVLLKQGANVETADCRGNTPIMAAFKNGHVIVVEWLIKLVHHLPSDELCHKILMSSVDDKEKEVIVQQRSKCLAIIQDMKKKRELLALKNAQNLVQELDDERDREEKKKKKKAAKRRKQNNRKKNKDGETEMNNEDRPKMNGIHVDEFDDQDEEENKDNLVPKENRVKVGDEKPAVDVLKISDIPSMPESCKEFLHNNQLNERKHSRKNDFTNNIENLTNQSKHSQENRKLNKNAKNLSSFENLEIDINGDKRNRSERSSPIEMMQLLTNRLSFPTSVANLNRQLPKTSGVCTQSSSTSGPSRIAVSSQTERILTKSLLSTAPNRQVTSRHMQQAVQLPAVSSVAVTTSAQSTTMFSDPRMEVSNIAPPEVRHSSGWDEEFESTGTITNSTTSRNSSFDEYRESDWKEISRTLKMVFYELTVPNSYCGRVIGKGGKKINLITEDSAAQITIDKPPTNIVPANRVITIKGAPINADKARLLVTKALNTPSLTNQEIINQPNHPNAAVRHPNAQPDGLILDASTQPIKETSQTQSKKRAKPLPSSEVRPLISYSKVAKATSTIDELEKEIETKCKVTNNEEAPPSDKFQITKHTYDEKPPPDKPPVVNDTKYVQDEKTKQPDTEKQAVPNDLPSESELKPTTNQITPPVTTSITQPIPSDENPTTSSSSRDDKNPFQPGNNFDSTFFFYDSYNRKNSEPSNINISKTYLFGEEKTPNCFSDNWPSSANARLTTDNIQPNDVNSGFSGVDRNRSISWTGQSKIDLVSKGEKNAGNRSLSIDQLDSGADKPPPIVKNNTWSSEVADEREVFGDDIAWPSSANNTNSNKQLDSTVSSSVGPNELYNDVSSSPTSSVSSSKVELTNYFDNDSGVGGSNPLDMTPTSLHEPPSSVGGGYNDQAPYLETNLDTQPWYQARSAYSAPSSPALPRNSGEHAHHHHHHHRSRGSSPRSAAMRSHPSMDGINRRPWPRTAAPPHNSGGAGGGDDISWKMSAFRNPSLLSTTQLDSSKVVRSPPENNTNDNHDSGLSSPHMTASSSSSASTDREVRRPPSVPTTAKNPPATATEEVPHQQVAATPISKSWSAERFQDVRTLSDLMKQLSLEKYTPKLEQSGISLEMIINLAERDLQAYEVPKGPRLKILKACQVIKSQQQQQQQRSNGSLTNTSTSGASVGIPPQSSASSQNEPATLPMSSSQLHHHLHQQQQHQQQSSLLLQQQQQHSQQLPSASLLHNNQQQQQTTGGGNFFSNIAPQHHQQHHPTSAASSFLQQQANSRSFEHHPSMPSNQQPPIGMSLHQQKQSAIQPPQQHVFSQQFQHQFPDFLSYPPPPAPHTQQMQQQQQNYNFILPQQQHQFMSSQQANHPCDDFGAVGFPPQHNMAAGGGADPMHQNSNLMSQPFMYHPENPAFYYFHPPN